MLIDTTREIGDTVWYVGSPEVGHYECTIADGYSMESPLLAPFSGKIRAFYVDHKRVLYYVGWGHFSPTRAFDTQEECEKFMRETWRDALIQRKE